MKKCIIVGACKDSQKEFSYTDEDFIIASDGGLEFLKAHNYRVDLVVGDFDSLKYIPKEGRYLLLNPIKDITDTHASIEYGVKKGYTNFEIYGCIGGRIDHSFAIIQDAYGFKLKGYEVIIHTSNQKIVFLKNDKMEIEKKNGYISIFAYGVAKGVTLKNLKYELDDKILRNNFPLGVSNEFINKKATIEVKNGCLVIIY